jgi:hypothetical protein
MAKYINNIEEKLGIDGSTDLDSIDYKLAQLIKGWISPNETFARASDTTMTIASGGATRYYKGDKIRLYQHSVWKYFYILLVADTLLTVVGNAGAVIEDTDTYPITLFSYSHISNPIGFPKYFTYTPVWTLANGTLTTTYSSQFGEFIIEGGMVTIFFKMALNVVSEATATKYFLISSPFPTSYMLYNAAGGGDACGIGRFSDASGGLQCIGSMYWHTTDLFGMWSSTGAYPVGREPNVTLATGDIWAGQITLPLT